MSLFSVRTAPKEELEELVAPKFLQVPGAIIRSDSVVPQTVRKNPLDPRAAEFHDQAIREASKAYTELVVKKYCQLLARAQENLDEARAWQNREIALAEEIATNIANHHLELVDAKDKFLELPRAKQEEERYDEAQTPSPDLP